jgi:hypothetical protein
MTENQRRYQKSKEAYLKRAKAWHHTNKERSLELKRNWAKRNREKVVNNHKLWKWRKEGIKDASIETYNYLFKEQNGVCALCKTAPQTRKLALDHHHDSGEIRGLLCYTCNIGIGHLERLMELEGGLEGCKTYVQKRLKIPHLPLI